MGRGKAQGSKQRDGRCTGAAGVGCWCCRELHNVDIYIGIGGACKGLGSRQTPRLAASLRGNSVCFVGVSTHDDIIVSITINLF